MSSAGPVQLGGHGVTAAVLRATYAASMRNLPAAIADFDLVLVYDNSLPASPTGPHAATAPLVLEALHGAIVAAADTPPDWLREALKGTKFAQ